MIEVTMEVVGVDDQTIHMESTAGHGGYWCGVVLPDPKDQPGVGDRLKVTLDSDEHPIEVTRGGEVIWP